MTDARPLLRQRIARLDEPPSCADRHGRPDPDAAHLVRVMETFVPPGVVADRSAVPTATAAEVDHLVTHCHLLRRIGERTPEIVVGPVRRDAQVWVATGPSEHRSPRSSTLEQGHFVAAQRAASVRPSTKPFDLGLFTSTGIDDGLGMWWVYLDLNRGSTLFTLPWTAWSVRMSADARVFEVGSASDWADLVATYPLLHDDLVYPDWRRVAEAWDAVHMTARAVIATQGIFLDVGDGRLAAALYWDVESTLWLRWVVADARLVHVESG